MLADYFAQPVLASTLFDSEQNSHSRHEETENYETRSRPFDQTGIKPFDEAVLQPFHTLNGPHGSLVGLAFERELERRDMHVWSRMVSEATANASTARWNALK